MNNAPSTSSCDKPRSQAIDLFGGNESVKRDFKH